jgi:glutaredoxin
MMSESRITLYSKPGCHLCDDARAVISKVAGDLGVAWEERDITQSEADQREYWDKIPVTFVDGVPHDFWRVSEDRLRRALSLSPGKRSIQGATGSDFVHSFTNNVWWVACPVQPSCRVQKPSLVMPSIGRT